jgi:hypothetical protein
VGHGGSRLHGHGWLLDGQRLLVGLRSIGLVWLVGRRLAGWRWARWRGIGCEAGLHTRSAGAAMHGTHSAYGSLSTPLYGTLVDTHQYQRTGRGP